MHKYEVIIYWSDRDGVFVAEVPELPGCCAHGDTKQAALDGVESAIGLWIDTAREFGDRVEAAGGGWGERKGTPCGPGSRAPGAYSRIRPEVY